MSRTRSGFSLIELLIVVVIIGVLATVAIPKYQTTKGKAQTTALKSDLRNLTIAEESYFYENQMYTNDLNALNFRLSPGVAMTFVSVSPGGWSATTTHIIASPMTCGIFQGTAAPPLPSVVQEGLIGCE